MSGQHITRRFSVHLSIPAREAIAMLESEDSPLKMPEWEGGARADLSRWFELAFGHFLISTLKGQMSEEQINEARNPTEMCELWVEYVKALSGRDSYEFSSKDVATRRIIRPQVEAPELWKKTKRMKK